jgi:tRNA dimethylallyltransferase
MAKTLIVVAGPTAVGKTALAIRLANHFQTEIISADSRQFYREMSIGTAKPNPSELKAAPHHFINTRSIFDHYTVGDFEREAIALVNEIFQSKEQIIMAGGSGLFINAVLYGFDELPAVPEHIRTQLNEVLQEKGLDYLQEKLRVVDPGYYKQVDLSNPQRVIRALEVSLASGKAYSSFRTGQKRQRDFQTIIIGLDLPREQLYQRINLRVDQMVQEGLIEEYTELFDYFVGKTSLDQALDQIKQNTRRFAKRQLTWFRRNENIRWFSPDDTEGIIAYITEQLNK